MNIYKIVPKFYASHCMKEHEERKVELDKKINRYKLKININKIPDLYILEMLIEMERQEVNTINKIRDVLNAA